MINKARTLPDPSGNAVFTANGTGTAVDISDLGEKDIYAYAAVGTFSASIQIQVSAKPGNTAPGTSDPSWINLGSAIAAAGTTHSLVRALWMRAVVSSYVAGAPAQQVSIVVVGDFAHEAGGRKVSG